MGFPKEFRFAVKLRIHNISNIRNDWNIMQISDVDGNLQFSIGLSPQSKTIYFSMIIRNGTTHTNSWHLEEVFDYKWHKIRFGIFRHLPSEHKDSAHKQYVALYLDCNLIGKMMPLDNAHFNELDAEGYMKMSVAVGTGETIPIDLQNMVITCNPNRIGLEICE